MKCLNVLLAQLIYAALRSISICDAHDLRFLTTKLIKNDAIGNDVLDNVNNLMQQLFAEISNKKWELEDPTQWPPDFANEYLKQGVMTFDYIIVGAGTAGSVVASRLSENPNVKVLVLEAGDNPPIQSEMHAISLSLLNTSFTWEDFGDRTTTSCRAMKHESCFWPRGRMIGGSGALNGNIFLTGYAEDFDDWHSQGNNGWSWNDVYPFYQKATQALGSENSPKGSLVLNHFQRLENYAILKDIMINGTKEMENSLTIKSFGYQENILATVDRGIRMSTGKTYLAKVARKTPNLFVIKNSAVTKILIKQNRAKGVKFLLNGAKMLIARATREIILSAGTFNSPKLLMLSGVGPQAHLKSLNIPVVKDLPVGQNFQDHGMMPLVLKFTKNIPEASDEITTHNLYEYLMFQKGPLASSPTLIGFMKTLESIPKNISDIMLVSHFSKPTKYSNVYAFLQFKPDLVEKFLEKVENQTTLEIEGLIIKPKSRGFLKLKSHHPIKGPLIHSNLGSAIEDQQTLLRFVRLIQKLQQTEIFKHYGLELVTVPLEECDQFVYDTNEYWLCYIKYFYISAWHAAGTCRMGPASDPTAVLDERLRVHGIKGLRVIDASIMPNITSANTNGPTIMIAEKGAQLIKDDWAQIAPAY